MANKIRKVETMRVSGELKKIINRVKARYLAEGKTAPSNAKITKIISDKINKGGLLDDIFIKF